MNKRNLKNLSRKTLGRATWHTLHHMSLKAEQPSDLYPVLDLIYNDYPCGLCRKHFRRLFRNRAYRMAGLVYPGKPVEFMQWLHNVVNLNLKPSRPAVCMSRHEMETRYAAPWTPDVATVERVPRKTLSKITQFVAKCQNVKPSASS